MKTRLLILTLLVISITIPVTSFAEHPIQTEKPQDSFHKGTIEWVIHCDIGRASRSTVRVIDYDMNQDPEKIEQFNIEVWSDYEDRIVDYTVTETGNNTGIFESTIFYKTTDESSGGRIRAFPDSIVFVKYVDYTLPNGSTKKDIIDTFVKSESPASGWRDGDMWKITYDPCMIEYLDRNKNNLDWFSIFYPAPLKQIESGLHVDEIQCKESLTLITKHDGSPACVKPETKTKLIERGWGELAPKLESEPVTIEKLLLQNQIDYLPDTLVVTSGPTIRGDPGCGAVIDADSQTHWFGINSISKPNEITLYSENPQMCIVNTVSCFCNAQREFTALTINELSYFTLQEEEKYAEILIDYLENENINRTPKFQIGKFNLNYTDSSAIGYCGELWGTNTYDFFEGAFVKDIVKDYSISKEISPLCAISDDTQYFGKMFGE